MKLDAFPLLAIGFILGLILGSMIPFKFMVALAALWTIFGATHVCYKRYKP